MEFLINKCVITLVNLYEKIKIKLINLNIAKEEKCQQGRSYNHSGTALLVRAFRTLLTSKSWKGCLAVVVKDSKSSMRRYFVCFEKRSQNNMVREIDSFLTKRYRK